MSEVRRRGPILDQHQKGRVDLGLLHDLVPKSVAIAALFHPGAPGAEFQMQEVEKAGQTIGRQS